MLTITLTSEERELLENLIREAISDLRMEIADTDSHDYRVTLHQQEDMLKQLVIRLTSDAETQKR